MHGHGSREPDRRREPLNAPSSSTEHAAKVTVVPASLTAKSAHSVPALTRAALHSRSVRCHRRGAPVSPSCAPHDTWPCLAEGRSFSLLQGVVCPRGRRSGFPASETGAAACHTPCPFSSPPGAFPARGSCSAQGGQRAPRDFPFLSPRGVVCWCWRSLGY